MWKSYRDVTCGDFVTLLDLLCWKLFYVLIHPAGARTMISWTQRF